jgi:cytochrome c-type biogenesis protein CcmH/NrfG
MKTLITVVALSLSPIVAIASQPVDNYATQAIASGQYGVAETQLMSRLAVAPSDQPALINLGHVYRQTNRTTAAHDAYRRVLARSNIRLTAVDGHPVWSHDVARAGLGGTVEVAMR